MLHESHIFHLPVSGWHQTHSGLNLWQLGFNVQVTHATQDVNLKTLFICSAQAISSYLNMCGTHISIDCVYPVILQLPVCLHRQPTNMSYKCCCIFIYIFWWWHPKSSTQPKCLNLYSEDYVNEYIQRRLEDPGFCMETTLHACGLEVCTRTHKVKRWSPCWGVASMEPYDELSLPIGLLWLPTVIALLPLDLCIHYHYIVIHILCLAVDVRLCLDVHCSHI